MKEELFSGMTVFLYFRLKQFTNIAYTVKSIFQLSVTFRDGSS